VRTLTDNHIDGDLINPMQTQSGTWGPGTITATANVTILPTVTITISPGTTIFVEDGVRFTVEGNLHSSGPLTFTPANSLPNPGDWKGILYAPGSSGYLTHATVQYAEHAVTLNTTHPVTIANSELRYNRYISDTLAAGAGLYIVQGNPLITGTQVHNNTIEATGEGEVRGGGIYIQDGSPHIINTWVYENTATGDRAGAGGGIGILAGGALIENSYILTNTITGNGGTHDQSYHYYNRVKIGAGIGFAGFFEEANAINTTVEIRNNWIGNNRNTPTGSGLAAGGGIGLGAYAKAKLLDSNVIINNIAGELQWQYGEGGGIDAWYDNDFIASNNLIYNNTATDSGGGVFLNGTAKAFNNTIVDNTADLGGGIYRQANQQQVFNNIVVDNRAIESSGGIFLQQDSGSAGYNNVWRNEPNNYDDPRAIPVTDYQVDPWFVDEGNIVERYHLLPYSPLTGVATDTLPGLPTTDYDGDERPKYIARDIGFDEVVLNPDLPTVSIQKSSPFLGSGEVLEYTVLIINNTTATYTTHITDVLPANVTYNSGPSANYDGNGSYDEAHNQITWEGTIPPNLFLNLRYSVLVDIDLPDGTPITNTATLSITNIVTPETLITTTNVVTTFVHNPNFELNQSPLDSETKIAGSPFTYQIEAKNTTQSGRATDVILTNTLPAHVYFVEASGAGVYQGQTISWTIPFIAAGGVVWRTVEVSTCQNFTNTLYRIITSTQLVSSTLGPEVTYSVIPPTIDASFEQSSAEAKVSIPVHFTSTSTTNGSSLTALWDFGDGITATGKTVSHSYVTSDTYTVRLIVADRCGFTSSQAVSISAYAPPLRISKNALTDVNPGETLTYTIIVLSEKNNTNVIISDTLPANTEFLTGSITLEPETVGDKGNAPPILAQAITLTPGQRMTLTYAAVVTSPLSAGTRIVNAVTVTSTEAPTPTRAVFTSTVVNVPPEISDTTRVITENVEMGTYVGVAIKGIDKNADTLTYTIIVSNPDQAFAIHPDTGQIIVSGGLDYEAQDQYTLTVQVTDDGALTDTARVTITVLNANEAPVINNATRTITENVPLGTLVGRPITGTDVDTDDILTYTIAGSSMFAIHPSTGQITVSGALDHEAQDQYTLTVQVIDTGALTDTAIVTIAVRDVNEAPVINDATRTITENVSPGTLVGNPVRGTDVDADDTLTYTIAGSSMFAIHPSSGQITVSGALDHEAQDHYTLTVQVTDGALSDTARVSITVLDINEAPVINDATRTITENVSAGTSVGAPVTGTDEDIDGDVLTYTINTSDQDRPFTIAPQTGQITVNNMLNYEAQSQYTLTVQASDGTLTDTAKVTITVLDVNEGPQFISTAITTATEDVVYTYIITATDPDRGDTMTLTAPTLPAWLTLTRTGNGTAKLNGTPNDTDIGDHPINLQVRDTPGLTATQRFTLHVRGISNILADIVLYPPEARIQAGESQTYTVEALDESGGRIGDISKAATYTISPKAQGSWEENIYTSEIAGTWTVTATYRTTAVATATLTITRGQSRDLNLDFAKTTIAAGEKQAYTTEAQDAFGNRWDVTADTTYTITPGAGGHWTDNVYTSEVAGTWTVTATYHSTVTTMTLTVIPGSIAQLTLSPTQATITAGQIQTYTLEAADAYQNTWDATASASYAISPQADGACSNNVCTSQVAGTWSITATYYTMTATATLSVTPNTPASIKLTPSQTTITVGKAQTYHVNAIDAFGNAWDATTSANYTISPRAGGAWSANVYTSEIVGTWTITATVATGTNPVSDTAMLNVRPLADLTLIKYTPNSTVRPGDTILYTLIYTNAGESETRVSAILTETVPAHTTFDAVMSTDGWICQPDIKAGSTCVYPLIDLTGGTSSHKLFAVTVNPSLTPTIKQISNTATVGHAPGYGPDPTPHNNTSTITVSVQHDGIDLAIHKTNHRDIVYPNDTLVYTLTIMNNGTLDATGVQVTDTLPTRVTFVRASHGGTMSEGNVHWPIFDLPRGGYQSGTSPNVSSDASTSRLITVTVNNDAIAGITATLTNTAYVSDDGRHGADTNPRNNRAEDIDTLQRAEQPDLMLTKQVTNRSVVTRQHPIEKQCYPGDKLHYTVTVQNTGNRVATQVIITDTLPPYVMLLSATPGGLRSETSSKGKPGASSNRKPEAMSDRDIVVWAFPDLNIGERRTYTITALVAEQIPTDNLSLINTAEASMSISDPTPDNNIAVAEIRLIQRPIPPSMLYLPLVTRNYTQAPDLIITSVIVTRDNVEITLKNVGERAVVNPFWVDLYVNPDPIPTGVNELWDELGEQGALWGFSNIPLDPEETVTLMLNDDAYWGHKSNLPLPLPEDAVIYVQVDSAHAGTNYGAVRESHEICDLPYNNIYGPISPTSQVNLTPIDPLRSPKPQSTEDLPPRE
jgi:uncharacterized repeat protein (TIGR01451 family)